MKNYKLQIIIALSAVLAIPALLWAQSSTCVTSYPECDFPHPPPQPNSYDCGAQGIYYINGPVDTFIFACRDTNILCAQNEIPCNVMTRAPVTAYYLTCSEDEQTTYCVANGTSIGPETHTGTDCWGNPCDNGQDPVPDTVPPNTDPDMMTPTPWLKP